MNGTLLVVVLQLVFLEGILSLDNAAALGAMVSPLPTDQPVPWPAALRRLGRVLDPLLGMQRDAALKVGLLGAYVGRGLMLALASVVIRNAWLRLLGGGYLLYLALHYLGHLGSAQEIEETGAGGAANRTNFWSVVVAVELADLAFSLDNVVVAVGLSDRFGIVLLGVAIGIVLMRFAATLFTRLIDWEPKLEIAAYLLVLAISVELLLDDLFGVHFVELHVAGVPVSAEVQQFVITLLILGVTIMFARVRRLQPVNVIWRPLLRVCAWLLVPFRLVGWPLRAAGRMVRLRGERSGR